MENKIKGMSFTKLLLGGLAIIGVLVFGEEWINGEGYSTLQSFIGYALSGGGVTAVMVIQILTKVIPQSTAQKLVDNVGKDKINGVFNTVENVVDEVSQLKQIIIDLRTQLDLEREARNELGVYDSLSQDTKDKLNV
jgi:hypothetical protein